MTDACIIDIEASGLHFDSYPIEIAVKIKKVTKSWLIKPEPSWTYWSSAAEGIHGITREDLDKNGVSAQRVAIELNEFLSHENGLVYSDAVDWDSDWISTLYKAADEPPLFHILSIFDLIPPEIHSVFLDTKARVAESGKYRLHRAADDAEIIYLALTQALSISTD